MNTSQCTCAFAMEPYIQATMPYDMASIVSAYVGKCDNQPKITAHFHNINLIEKMRRHLISRMVFSYGEISDIVDASDYYIFDKPCSRAFVFGTKIKEISIVAKAECVDADPNVFSLFDMAPKQNEIISPYAKRVTFEGRATIVILTRCMFGHCNGTVAVRKMNRH